MGQEFDGYDRWKAQEPRPDEDTCCHECGEERCKCEPDEVLDQAPEAITDEQVAELVAELREKRLTVEQCAETLATLERVQRDEVLLDLRDLPVPDTTAMRESVLYQHGRREEREAVIALLRAALGTAS